MPDRLITPEQVQDSQAQPTECHRGPYSLRCDSLAQADASLVSQWKSFHAQHSSDEPMLDPEWLHGYFDDQIQNVRFYSLYQSGRLSGLAPFLRRDWPMQWHLGPWKVAQCPLVRLRLLGTSLEFPADEAAYDMLFRELSKAGRDFDTVYLEETPLDSFLWTYLHRSEFIRKNYLLYQPRPAAPRPALRVEGTFQQYMGKFNSKHRNTLNRKIKKLREGALGEMRLVRYESPSEAPAFLEQALEISRKTYQWARYGRGLSAVEKVRKRLFFAASHGWMRSYLLFCGGEARAFLLGFQYNGRFLLDEIGFDPDLARYSVGTVLQLLTVEDLFAHHRPHVFDLQEYGGYKEVLSTDSYLEGKLFLFRRSAYARLLRSGHRACALLDRTASSALERFNLKATLRQKVRGW
ncbi:MAG TPA: GNAT family N-acetyltransferase [Candidatus Acidoferrales bacterium]|nr:GNAT family N-acetyltransferase [Candidatus Acidoferrales bacterium]